MPEPRTGVSPPCAGSWPNGEPQSAGDAADRETSLRPYDVYMVVIGGYDTYEVVAVYADRRAAGHKARSYNQAHGRPSDIDRCARVEEISFHPAQASASPPGEEGT
jgi:hypothetical protein